MMSFSFNRDPRRKHFMNFVTKVHDLIQEAYWEENSERGLTKAQIAQALDKNKGLITRWIETQSNMTFESLSDLTFALNRDIEISFPKKIVHHQYGANFFTDEEDESSSYLFEKSPLSLSSSDNDVVREVDGKLAVVSV